MDHSDKIRQLEEKTDRLQSELNSIRNELKQLHPDASAETNLSASRLQESAEKAVTAEKIPAAKKEFREKNKFLKENFLGANLFGKLGFLAILLGTGWFLKFAIDRQWLNESARIILGTAGGHAVFVFALYQAKKNLKILPPAAAGAALGILFLTIFSAYYFYNFLNTEETFIYLLTLILWSAVLARTSNSESLYVFSLIGAFLTPIILSSGENSYRFLFTYLTVINSIFLWISYTRPWKIVPFLVLAFNLLLFIFWAVEHIYHSSRFIAFAYIFILFIQFHIREIFFVPAQSKKFSLLSMILFFLNYIAFTGCGVLIFYFEFDLNQTSAISIFILSGALLLSLTQMYLEKRKSVSAGIPDRFRSAFIIFWFTSASVALFYFFESEWAAAGIIALGAMFYFTGTVKTIPALQILTFPLYFATFIYLFFIYSLDSDDQYFLLNERMLLFTLMVAAPALVYKMQRDRGLSGLAPRLLLIGITIIAYFSFYAEISDFVKNFSYRNLYYSLTLAAFALVFFLTGFIRNNKDLRFGGIIFVFLIVLKLYLYDIWNMNLAVRIIALFTLGIGLVSLSFAYNKLKNKILPPRDTHEV